MERIFIKRTYLVPRAGSVRGTGGLTLCDPASEGWNAVASPVEWE